jgi:hypothetical protein
VEHEGGERNMEDRVKREKNLVLKDYHNNVFFI